MKPAAFLLLLSAPSADKGALGPLKVPSVDKGTHGSAPQICDSASLLSLGVPQYAAFQCLAESQI